MVIPLPRAIAAALVALAAAPVYAQDASDQDERQEQATELDAIRVTSPIVSSQGLSIDLQREAVNVANMIASDAIGDFPDQTAAGALARLPGVAVQRDQGQERYIQIRGAPARWTTVAFDGIDVVGAEDRTFRFDSVPATLVDVVQVNKTLTPDMPGDSLAGRVDIQTVSPMAQRGWHGQVDLGYGNMSLGGGDQKQGSGRLAWSNDRFGILIGGSTYSREQVTDNREFSYDDAGILESASIRNYQLERETNSGILKAEWRPAEGHKLSLSSLYTEFKDHELRNQYDLDFSSALSGSADTTYGSYVGVPVTRMLQDGEYFNSTWTHTLAGEHVLEKWQLNWAVNHTRTRSQADLPLIYSIQTDPENYVSVDYDRSNVDTPTYSLYQTVANGDGSYSSGDAISSLNDIEYDLDLYMPYVYGTQTSANTFKFDASRSLELAWAESATLRLGTKIDARRASGNSASYQLLYLSSYADALGLDWDVSDYQTDDSWDSDFTLGTGASYVDNAALRNKLQSVLEALAGYGLYDSDDTISPDSRFAIEEDVAAAYAMLEARTGRSTLLGGVRVEYSRTTSSGYLVDENDAVTSTSSSYRETYVLPSLHWNFDISETLKLRNALVTGLARPDFADMRASASIDDTDREISGGNPDLKPETAWGYDGSLEWYFADASIASAGWFYRDVKDVIFDSTSTVTDNRYDSDGMSRVGYTYTTTLNGGDGRLYGLELNWQQPFSFLPAPWDGFGAQVNVAFLDGEFTTPEGRKAAFPGTSKRLANASLYYEKGGLSLRAAYQWRDRWLDDVSVDSGEDIYWDDTAQLDFSMRYAFSRNVSVYFDANNLSDQRGVRYQGNRRMPTEVEGFGRRYMAGVRVRF